MADPSTTHPQIEDGQKSSEKPWYLQAADAALRFKKSVSAPAAPPAPAEATTPMRADRFVNKNEREQMMALEKEDQGEDTSGDE